MAWRPSITSRGTNSSVQHASQNLTVHPADTIAFFIKNSEFPQGQLFHVLKPEHISTASLEVIQRPKVPEKRQAVLQLLEPCTLFVQYPCLQNCRSLGTCVHYQFVAGCRRCPDGL